MGQKLYIIGGEDLTSEEIRKNHLIPEGTELILVKSVDDIPFGGVDTSMIRNLQHIEDQIFLIPPQKLIDPFIEKKNKPKSHIRSYKYHK